ncbi:MAG: phosphomannomutase [Actinobacteria bacterium RBG_16_64_13]|nr:MAG: phosphomannomutase [Actinobacteria bacterium RBG_16_64_13]
MGSGSHLECFKAYDVRGRVPDELNPAMVELIGRAYAQLIQPKQVAVGHDVRLTSSELAEALSRGLTDSGVEVVDIGMVGTEEVYHATFSLGLDGGIMVTASHNPRDYNGMKFTRDNARPISADTGLLDIEEAVVEALKREGNVRIGWPGSDGSQGSISHVNTRLNYVHHLLTYVDVGKLRPLKVVVNAGNGGAGPVIDLLERSLPLEFVKINHTPDGSFPAGVPNPMLPENRAATAQMVLAAGADLGIAWDGDFDRCFFFDEHGEFVEGYYLVGLLAERALKRHPGAPIIHDPRLVWNTVELVKAAGGVPVVSKSGHAFIKEKMRAVDAAYGGEMSAHHYFKEFSYCDSGMIPWLQVVEAMSQQGRPLSEMVGERIERYPISGEINLTLSDSARALSAVRRRYGPGALSVDELDGLSIEFQAWRLNVRTSNTEPVVRLNLETRGDKDLLQTKTQEVLDTLERA